MQVIFKCSIVLIYNLVYLFSFIFSIANAPIDDEIYHNNSEDKYWYEEEALFQDINDKLKRWYIFNMIRVITSFLGWLLSCIDYYLHHVKL